MSQLNSQQKEKLTEVLSKHETAFQGGLGKAKDKPIHLELKQGAKPYHGKAFPLQRLMKRPPEKKVKGLNLRESGITIVIQNGLPRPSSNRRKRVTLES